MFKTKWTKDGAEIDACVQIKQFVIGNAKNIMGTSEAASGFGSLLMYTITEDEAGTKVLSKGQCVQEFDMDGTLSVKDYIKSVLANFAKLTNLEG